MAAKNALSAGRQRQGHEPGRYFDRVKCLFVLLDHTYRLELPIACADEVGAVRKRINATVPAGRGPAQTIVLTWEPYESSSRHENLSCLKNRKKMTYYNRDPVQAWSLPVASMIERDLG